jgi:hypothetical protein
VAPKAVYQFFTAFRALHVHTADFSDSDIALYLRIRSELVEIQRLQAYEFFQTQFQALVNLTEKDNKIMAKYF